MENPSGDTDRSKSRQQKDVSPTAVDAPTSLKSEIGVEDTERQIAQQPEATKRKRRRHRLINVIVQGVESTAAKPNDHKMGRTSSDPAVDIGEHAVESPHIIRPPRRSRRAAWKCPWCGCVLSLFGLMGVCQSCHVCMAPNF